jgi:uncharacterized membrane protein YkvI
MKQWTSILLVAATYIGTVVGAGFATGKEIVTFFSKFEVAGTIGAVISCYLLILFGTKIMILSSRIKAYSYKEFNVYLFGRKWGNLVNVIIFIIVISVTSVMLSGAGAVFREQLGVPYQVGILSTLFLCYFVVMHGLKGLFAINAYIVPLIILFGLFVFISVFDNQPHQLLELISPNKLPNHLHWMTTPFTYASFNIITAMVVLVPLGKEIQDEHVLKWGGFLGGIGLFIILLLNHLSLSAHPESFLFEIPTAEIVKQFGSMIHVLFLLVIYGEIFNTVVANVYGVARQLSGNSRLKYNYAVLIILIFIFFISQIGYGQLLTVLYPLFGYLGLFFLGVLLMKRMPDQ